jgi:zinc protease
LESAQLVKEILGNYPKNYSAKDLETTKGFLIKSNARAFETAGAKLNMLENISKYGFRYDYVKDREAIVKATTVEDIKNLSNKYLDPDKFIWLFVGDAKSQLGRLKELGFGEPALLNK